MRRRVLLSLAAAFVALATIALAWKVRGVSGVVFDESGVPVPGAVVRIRATSHSAMADEQGRFTLSVRASDSEGRPLALVKGETVPEWGGVGDPAQGYYAGLPGKAFAKVLRELWTEIAPTGAYWNPTVVLSDNRLAAFATDTSTYAFAAPQSGGATVEVTLLFRRAFKRERAVETAPGGLRPTARTLRVSSTFVDGRASRPRRGTPSAQRPPAPT